MSESIVAQITSSPAPELSKAYNRDKAAPPGPHETKQFAARCHCRAIQFSIHLPVASLPLRAYICHCSICRYTQGTFARTGVILPLGIAPDWTDDSMTKNLTTYMVPGHLTPRQFCSTCGTTIGGVGPTGQWTMAVPLFDEKFWVFGGHGFPKSAPGGGLLDWVLEPDATAATLQEKYIWFSPEDKDFPTSAQPEFAADGTERLRAECCCGGVSFTVPRPSQAVVDDPYMGGYVVPSLPAPNDPTTTTTAKKKWKALLDLCRDCGRLSGASVVPWMLVPRVVVEPALPPDLQGAFGTLKTYKSSEPNTRGFCGVCGASVFIATKRREPTAGQAIVNVAMGLLRAPEGVRAEDWVVWRAGAPAWAEDAKGWDEEFTVALVEGHRRWGMEKYGEAPEFFVI
ncbi:hypothetical protein PG989_007126 [Apiospora arundinis]